MRRSLLTLALTLALTFVGTVGTVAIVAPAMAEDSAVAPNGDVVVLKDGRRIEGELVGKDERFVSIRSAGVLRAYPLSEVADVIAVPRPAAPLPPATDGTDGTDGTDPQGTTGADGPGKADRKGRKKGRRGKAAASPDGPGQGTDGPGRATDGPGMLDTRGQTDARALTPEAHRWLISLLDRALASDSPDPAVARSITAAIRALGPGAGPVVKETVGDTAGPVADALRRLAGDMGSKTKKRDTATSDAPVGGDRASVYARVMQDLGLTREEGKAFKSVVAEHAKSFRAVVQNARQTGTDRAQVRAELETLRGETMSALRGVLGDERFARFEPNAAELFQALGEGKRGRKKPKKDSGAPPQ